MKDLRDLNGVSFRVGEDEVEIDVTKAKRIDSYIVDIHRYLVNDTIHKNVYGGVKGFSALIQNLGVEVSKETDKEKVVLLEGVIIHLKELK